MVDNNENQFDEDIEYTEENVEEETTLASDDDDNSYVDESEEDQEGAEEDEESYEEYEEEEGEEGTPKKKNALPLVILLLVLLIAGGFIAVPKMMGPRDGGENVAYNNEQNVNNSGNAENQQSQEDLAASFFDEASEENNDMMSVNFNEENNETNVITGEGEEQQVATVTEPEPEAANNTNETDLFENHEEANQNNDSIMVVYNKAARLNPFKPPIITQTYKEIPYETINNTQFEIIEPPTASVPDENLTRLLQTKISGILYDTESPSAIVNLNGMDQFVKIGDTVSGYKIENITRDKVQISYKNNSYVASVGELFSQGYLEKQQAVANLENKFGGRYKN